MIGYGKNVGQQFHQYQQNKQPPLASNRWNTKKDHYHKNGRQHKHRQYTCHWCKPLVYQIKFPLCCNLVY